MVFIRAAFGRSGDWLYGFAPIHADRPLYIGMLRHDRARQVVQCLLRFSTSSRPVERSNEGSSDTAGRPETTGGLVGLRGLLTAKNANNAKDCIVLWVLARESVSRNPQK